jgi:hypothetical protein
MIKGCIFVIILILFFSAITQYKILVKKADGGEVFIKINDYEVYKQFAEIALALTIELMIIGIFLIIYGGLGMLSLFVFSYLMLAMHRRFIGGQMSIYAVGFMMFSALLFACAFGFFPTFVILMLKD